MTMILAAHNLTLAVGTRTLVRELTLELRPGEFWGLLGPNGAGKTMLLHALAGLAPSASGSVTVDNHPIGSVPRQRLAARLAVLFQDETADYWGAVREYVELGRLPSGPNDQAVERALAILELGPLAARPFRSLSGGERQRARIAQCLAQTGETLLLDEPLNHLDLRHQALVVAHLQQLAGTGASVVASLHDPGWAAAHCSHAILMYHSGRVVQGVAAEVITHAHAAALYDVPVATIARMVQVAPMVQTVQMAPAPPVSSAPNINNPGPR